ncbi:hypothetical protein JMJ56_21160 [Belnapia sp. T18]|uniref:Uncharacterized protein n=1 Tax=Belnapia arida TaxID=2804533 RepID=A0ABS1U8P4_9PROT|nr:hypothetical protein [Belnapia arida]MBL6080530.1 hypothetical protein [Belnapia arida]
MAEDNQSLEAVVLDRCARSGSLALANTFTGGATAFRLLQGRGAKEIVWLGPSTATRASWPPLSGTTLT